MHSVSLISYSYCYPCKTFPKNNVGRTGKWVNMAFKVLLQYGCSQPSSSIFVLYIVLVWGFQAEFIVFNMFFKSSCAGLYRINVFWIFSSQDCLISPYGQEGYNVVPISWNIVTVLLFSPSSDHVYEWLTVTDLFQTEATSCTKYIIPFYYSLTAVSSRLWVVM